jgi:hypothetical protein
MIDSTITPVESTPSESEPEIIEAIDVFAGAPWPEPCEEDENEALAVAAALSRRAWIERFQAFRRQPRRTLAIVKPRQPERITIEALMADPTLAITLSLDERRGYILQAAAFVAILGASMIEPEQPDECLSVEQLATLSGMSRDYLYRHAKELPYYIRPLNGARKVQFSRRGWEADQRRKTGGPNVR